MAITLHEITQDNWRECAGSILARPGRAFIPSNLCALAESRFTPSLLPLAIYWVDRMAASSYTARSPSRIAAIAPTA